MTSSVGLTSAAATAPSQSEKEPAETGQFPPEPEKEPEGTDEVSDAQAGKDDSHKQAGKQCATAQTSSKPTSSTSVLTQDATASLEESTSDHLIDNLMEWERKFESADLEKHKQFLQEAQLLVCDNPLEATAWENGFVPEARGIPSDQLEFRIQGSLPPLAYMVSRPRQPTITGEDLMRRFDAGMRPYWLRDWQTGSGGYTKVYEYQVNGETRRKFSVAHVVRPRTQTSNACLCFTLMSNMPDQKPWKRSVSASDPSRGVLLDLQEDCEWKMPSTVMLCTIDSVAVFDDNLQVQCLPVFGSDHPKWTYRKVPKVTAFRSFTRLQSWCRKPQKMTYHLCAEDLTRSTIVPKLPEEEQRVLVDHGILPQDSSAKDRFCVMCPVKRGSPRLLACCLCYNWCHIGCSYQTHLGRVCPCHVQILDPKRKIIVLRHPSEVQNSAR